MCVFVYVFTRPGKGFLVDCLLTILPFLYAGEIKLCPAGDVHHCSRPLPSDVITSIFLKEWKYGDGKKKNHVRDYCRF